MPDINEFLDYADEVAGWVDNWDDFIAELESWLEGNGVDCDDWYKYFNHLKYDGFYWDYLRENQKNDPDSPYDPDDPDNQDDPDGEPYFPPDPLPDWWDNPEYDMDYLKELADEADDAIGDDWGDYLSEFMQDMDNYLQDMKDFFDEWDDEIEEFIEDMLLDLDVEVRIKYCKSGELPEGIREKVEEMWREFAEAYRDFMNERDSCWDAYFDAVDKYHDMFEVEYM